MILVLLLVIAAKTQDLCGYDRTKMLLGSGSGCGSSTSQRDCLLSMVLYSNGQVFQCYWNATTSTCYDPEDINACNPSCFANAKQKFATTCASLTFPATCNQAYTGTYGSSSMCFYDSSTSTCKSTACDLTCTGYQKATTCTGISQYQCPTYYYDDGTNYRNCQWSGSACVQGEICRKVCNGVYSTTNCTLYNYNAPSCHAAYETRSGVTYDCIYNIGTALCSSKYPQQCVYPGASSCTGSYGGLGSCSSFFTTQTTCNSGFVYDDTPRQCKWNIGSSVCNDDKPCTIP